MKLADVEAISQLFEFDGMRIAFIQIALYLLVFFRYLSQAGILQDTYLAKQIGPKGQKFAFYFDLVKRFTRGIGVDYIEKKGAQTPADC